MFYVKTWSQDPSQRIDSILSRWTLKRKSWFRSQRLTTTDSSEACVWIRVGKEKSVWYPLEYSFIWCVKRVVKVTIIKYLRCWIKRVYILLCGLICKVCRCISYNVLIHQFSLFISAPYWSKQRSSAWMKEVRFLIYHHVVESGTCWRWICQCAHTLWAYDAMVCLLSCVEV